VGGALRGRHRRSVIVHLHQVDTVEKHRQGMTNITDLLVVGGAAVGLVMQVIRAVAVAVLGRVIGAVVVEVEVEAVIVILTVMKQVQVVRVRMMIGSRGGVGFLNCAVVNTLGDRSVLARKGRQDGGSSSALRMQSGGILKWKWE
jgi:hypothetical protein